MLVFLFILASPSSLPFLCFYHNKPLFLFPTRSPSSGTFSWTLSRKRTGFDRVATQTLQTFVKQKKKKKGIRVTDKCAQRLTSNFLDNTFDRKDQLLEILDFAGNPTMSAVSNKGTVLMTVSGPGTGKTHIVDEIPRCFEPLKREIEAERGVVESRLKSLKRKKKVVQDQTTKTMIEELEEKLITLDKSLEKLSSKKDILQRKTIFFPICFNSRTPVIFCEKAKQGTSPLTDLPSDPLKAAVLARDEWLRARKSLVKPHINDKVSASNYETQCQSLLALSSQAYNLALHNAKNLHPQEDPKKNELVQETEAQRNESQNMYNLASVLPSSYRASAMLVARVLYIHFCLSTVEYDSFVATFSALIDSLSLREALDIVRYDYFFGIDENTGEPIKPAKDTDARIFLIIDEIAKVPLMSERDAIFNRICTLVDTGLLVLFLPLLIVFTN